MKMHSGVRISGPRRASAKEGFDKMKSWGSRTLSQNHSACQILNGLFDHIIQHPHQCHCLLLAKALAFESLDDFERVEMVIPTVGRCTVECAAGRFEYRHIHAIMSY